MCKIIVLALALAVSTTAAAQGRKAKDAPVQMDMNAPIAEQISKVEAALADENYSELSNEDKFTVQQALGRIKLKTDTVQTINQLNPQAKTEVFNEQEVINTLLTKARADSRMVCRREKSVGSNFPTSVCMTVAERRRRADEDRNSLERQQRNGRQFDTGVR